jgi:preprotein translocase subunit SecD
MKRRLVLSLVGIVVVAVAALVTNLSVGNKPLLGLDLQGGASVTLTPATSKYDATAFGEVAKLYRARIQSLNIGEAEVLQQGNTIVVNLPGVKDQEQAINLIGTTGKVTFRKVLARQGGFSGLTVPLTGSSAAGTSGATGAVGASGAPIGSGAPTTSAVATTSTVTATSSATVTTAANGPSRAPRQASATTTGSTTAAASTTVAGTPTTTPAATTTTSKVNPEALITPADQDIASATVFLPDRSGTTLYELGPVFAEGQSAVSSAVAQINTQTGQWEVALTLKGGAGGLGAWNTAASSCYAKDTTCPDGGMAIIIDHQVISAPVPQQQTFSTADISITGNFKQSEASNLARVLRYGATPIEMKVQASQTVSATLGKNSLRAGLVAGAIGVGLVLVLMLLYYRRLALVVLAGLCVSGSLIWSAVTMFNNFFVLTLAGVTGIIVSIGVTVDSYVVFFERLKDEVRTGRSLRNSAQRGFSAAWRTILAADFVSLLGAVVLWYLSVGSVRGFALFLGLSTICDMVVAWFFTRPAVILLSRSRTFQKGSVFGIQAGEAINSTGGAA